MDQISPVELYRIHEKSMENSAASVSEFFFFFFMLEAIHVLRNAFFFMFVMLRMFVMLLSVNLTPPFLTALRNSVYQSLSFFSLMTIESPRQVTHLLRVCFFYFPWLRNQIKGINGL